MGYIPKNRAVQGNLRRAQMYFPRNKTLFFLHLNKVNKVIVGRVQWFYEDWKPEIRLLMCCGKN
jgi:hypothetical protein